MWHLAKRHIMIAVHPSIRQSLARIAAIARRQPPGQRFVPLDRYNGTQAVRPKAASALGLYRCTGCTGFSGIHPPSHVRVHVRAHAQARARMCKCISENRWYNGTRASPAQSYQWVCPVPVFVPPCTGRYKPGQQPDLRPGGTCRCYGELSRCSCACPPPRSRSQNATGRGRPGLLTR